MFNKNWWFLNFQKEFLNFSFCIRKLAVAFYMINEIQPKIKFQNIVQCPFNIIYFFHICNIQQNTRKYNTLLQKNCGGLGNKPKACQVLDSIILQIYWVLDNLIIVRNNSFYNANPSEPNKTEHSTREFVVVNWAKNVWNENLQRIIQIWFKPWLDHVNCGASLKIIFVFNWVKINTASV